MVLVLASILAATRGNGSQGGGLHRANTKKNARNNGELSYFSGAP